MAISQWRFFELLIVSAGNLPLASTDGEGIGHFSQVVRLRKRQILETRPVLCKRQGKRSPRGFLLAFWIKRLL